MLTAIVTASASTPISTNSVYSIPPATVAPSASTHTYAHPPPVLTTICATITVTTTYTLPTSKHTTRVTTTAVITVPPESHSPYNSTGTGYTTRMSSIPYVNGTSSYKPSSIPPPYTAAADAMRVPVAVAGMVGLAAMVL
jgi:hypothetical protein